MQFKSLINIKKDFFPELFLLLVFSFFTAGCRTGNEAAPVKTAAVEKAEASKHTVLDFKKTDLRKKTPETSAENDASGILFPKTDTAAGTRLRDPFASPGKLHKVFHNGTGTSEIQKEQLCTGNPSVPVPSALNRTGTIPRQNAITMSPPVSQTSCRPQDPFLYGLFDNGKEKLVLLGCNQIRGLFRSGDTLPNGYHVGDVTNSSVTLYPPRDAANNKALILRLQ